MQQSEAEPTASPEAATEHPHHAAHQRNMSRRGHRRAHPPSSTPADANFQSSIVAPAGVELKPVAAGRLMWHVVSGASATSAGQAKRSNDEQLQPIKAEERAPAPEYISVFPSSPKAIRCSNGATASAARDPCIDLASPAGDAALPAAQAAPIGAVTATLSPADLGKTDSPANLFEEGAKCHKEDSAEAAADVDGLLEEAVAEFRAGAAEGIVGKGGAPTVSKVALSPPHEQPRSPVKSKPTTAQSVEPKVKEEEPEGDPADTRTAQQRDGGLSLFVAELDAKYAMCAAQVQEAEADLKTTVPGSRAAALAMLRRMQAGMRNMECVLGDLRAGIAAMPSDDVLYARPAEAAEPQATAEQAAAPEVVCLDGGSDRVRLTSCFRSLCTCAPVNTDSSHDVCPSHLA